MKTLFVSSGNSKEFTISPFIRAQGESLKKQGIDVSYYPIKGKGVTGYLKSAIELHRLYKKKQFDLIHAHYVLSGWSAVLSYPKKPVVLSILGADIIGNYIDVNKIDFSSIVLILLSTTIQPFVRAIVLKSTPMKRKIIMKKKAIVIPNGINLEVFKPLNQSFNKEFGLPEKKKNVLFLGNRQNKRKNFKLLEQAVSIINKDEQKVNLVAPFPVQHDRIVDYLNSVDLLVLPSFSEGSPNVVKEAMACNCPVVATDVGDVKLLFGNIPGYHISDFTPEDMAEKITNALHHTEINGRPDGRKRIIELGLDSETVAKRIIELYKEILE